MKYDFSFPYGTLSFDLTQADEEHGKLHKTGMRSWDGPMGGDALSGVDWNKLYRSFPRYRFECKECTYKGGDYEKNGQPKQPLILP